MDWLEQTDEGGNLYYYNLKTGESSWEAPEGYVKLNVINDWVEQRDEQGNLYYYNVTSGESSWEAPDGFQEQQDYPEAQQDQSAEKEIEPSEGLAGTEENAKESTAEPEPNPEPEPEPEELEATVEDDAEGVAPTEIETEKQVEQAQVDEEEDPVGVEATASWTKLYDSAHGAYYYHNNATGDCQWELPEDYIEPPEGQTAQLPVRVGAAMQIQNVVRRKLAQLRVKGNSPRAFIIKNMHVCLPFYRP